jgi:PAS domain S-box-containing protein
MSEGAARARLRPPELGRYLIMAVLLPAVLVSLGLWLESEYARMRRTAELVDVIAMRRVAAIDLLATLRKAESEQRGFVITRNPDFLMLYEPSRHLAGRDLEVVLRQTPVAKLSPERLRLLRELIAAKFAEMDAVLGHMRAGRHTQALARVANGEGRLLMIRIEAQLQALIASDATLLANSSAANHDHTLRSRQLVWLVIGSFGTLLLVGVILLWHSRRERWRVAVAEADAFARNQAVLDGTSDAIVILNPSGTIENVNAAARTVLGYEPAELSRRDVSVVIDIADGNGSFHERIGLVDGKLRRTLFVDRHARTKDGRKIPVDVALGLMPVPDGLHIVASIRDISHRREIERIKDDFIATVSHELRTPLTSVVGSLGLLRGGAVGSLPPSAQQLVEIAENNARRLIRLTNDILDLEKFGSGQMTLALASTDLVAIMRQAAAEIGAAARLKSVEIKLACSHDSCPVMADHQRLLQVATNLLSNAVRHTPEGSTVSISTELSDDKAEVRICDQGPGVPVEYRQQVFDRFVQTPDQDGISGTGLGLAIAREIVHRHGGRIWIEDAPGGGACFVFALPCLSHAGPVIVPNDPASEGASADRADTRLPTILQIDDDIDLVRVVAASLAGEARVIRANGIASARAVLGLDVPDVIVLDIGLPDGSGADLLPMLVDRSGQPIPTIVFSAQDIPVELRNSEQIKAVLTKSRSTLPTLRAAIRRILSEEHVVGGEGA